MYTNDHIHAAQVRVYVHTFVRVDVIAEKAMQKVKQTCWSGLWTYVLYTVRTDNMPGIIA